VSFETSEHHDQHQEMMREIKRVLRPGGLLIISSPDKLYYSDLTGLRNPYHVKELYRDEFEALLREHFAHHLLLGQRVMYASALLDDKVGEVMTLSTDNPQGKVGMPEPVYLVAVASDGDLPKVNSSLFQHDVA